ncbi:prespore-specific regulator [Pullulanibacillus pueri]|uniref:Transcriptional regulator n=1 Tax=Pullulanibacillus pueri TaxID=1437324 RepID=A0A8J2ZRM8_9BACL|nr:RsfA family transcriptional regulator [Pullulanibacillus pueri]MBM7680120.1 prespore-specific regulator [Pullulanibacillus pueri]GGH74459.1 transcriptional regulator [Pullulanibacillus pueri]
MSTIRQDAWNDEEDLLLAETVLRHIREGSTQLKAFQEVGKKLSRTSAACGFRWNSLVRKQYETAILLAKQQRKALAKQKKTEKKPKPIVEPSQSDVSQQKNETTPSLATLDLSSVIAYLESVKESGKLIEQLQSENERLKKDLEDLRQRESQVEEDYVALKAKYTDIEKEYQTLLSMMDKARQLAQSNLEKETSKS